MRRRQPSEALLALVENYFVEYLGRTRGASQHTIRAYADGLRLFLIYLGDRARRPVSKLTLDDIEAEAVVAFLNDLEKLRENAVATRNSRRAAIRGFVEHLLRHDLSRAEQYRRVLAIPTKRARTRVICYLEPTEVRTIIAQPDISTAAGERDHALLLFLYNTGARISEALDVRWRDLRLRHPRQVELHGKGRKTRLCPLWPETTVALGRLMPETSFPDDVVFRNARGASLTRDGAAYLIRKYAQRAAESTPHMKGKRVTPHVLRHSCAVALLQAGVDVSVIRDYLGHASVATTSRYISTNLEMRRAALETFWETSGLTGPKKTKWKPSEKLLAFLSSL
jgi:site-specific recombinase XerD